MTDDLTSWIMMWSNLRSDMMKAVGALVFERAALFDGDALSILTELDSIFNKFQEDQREMRRAAR